MTAIPISATSPTILIVDDTPANVAVIVDSLEHHGFRVVVAQDGEEGLQRALFVKPDLILLDVMMPELDGFEVCRRLKSHAETCAIPVIFMTSLTETEDKLSGFKAGGVDYVTKPLNIDEVIARVNTHLRLHTMQKQLEAQHAQLQQYREGLELQVVARTSALAASEKQFRTLTENLPDIVVRYDLDFRRVYVNPAYCESLGVAVEDVLNTRPDEVWRPTNVTPGEYLAKLQRVMQYGTGDQILLEFPGPDGYLISNAVQMVAEHDPDGKVIGVLTIARDVSDIMRHERQEEIQLKIFESLAHGADLADVLELVVSYVEKARPDFLASIMLIDDDGKHLRSANAPHLPAEYLEAIDGIEIGDAVGSCGTAAWRRETVLAEDIRTHPYWAPYKHLALEAGLLACWSEPILDASGHILGTFGIYLRRPGRPSDSDTELVRQASHLAAIAIERKRAAEKLWESERKYRTLVEDSPDLFIRYDRDCRRIYVSDAYQHMYGLPPNAVLGKRPTELWGAQRISPEEFENRLKHVMDTGERAEIEIDWYDADGTYICHSMRAVPEYDREGNLVSVLSITRDVSEAKRAEKALHLQEQELRSLVENTPDTIARYDTQCRRIYANPKMLCDLGGRLDDALNKTPSEFPGGESALAYEERIRQVLANGQSEDFELAWKSGEGKQVVSYIRLTPEFGIDGKIVSVLAVGRDITEIDEYRQSIHHLAFYDTLTDLPNRSLLSDRIKQTIADASWHGYLFGLMLLDLDRFKEVNDTLGHGVGDALLREAAGRLLECVRIYDTVARLGGDEFAILLPQVRDSGDLALVAQKIIEAFQQPFQISGKELFVSASIGIALYPSDSAEIDALFKYADSAMYHAKKKGRNNFQFYASELTARSAERMALDAALRKAIKKDELELYYQPQVELASGCIIGAEALLRWKRSDGSMVMPDKFIPVAEETGLIVGIGEWVLETACRAAVEWNLDRQTPFKVAVNLSTRQFIQNDLLGSVRRILSETQCRPEWLKLEITESLLLEDSADILEILEAFDDMGLAISIDDFGTGYSALSYLNRFPVSQIKIDRSFVRDIPGNQEKAELVKAMISIAQTLHLELVAEGVETREQAEYLNLHHCLIGQGYLFGKPMPHSEFLAHMAYSAP
ncbi:MAG: EAL domain-containing protein [Methylophilaceae bacterium]